MNVPHVIVGVGSIIAGLSELRNGFQKQSPLRGFGNKFELPSAKELAGKPFKARVHTVGHIDSRVSYIIDTIKKGRKDPRMRAFAVSAVSKKCGNRWCVPERDWWGEVRQLFGAIRENVRYIRDIHNLDTFQSPSRTLQFGGGDCDDYTITLGSALQSIGYPIKIRIVQSKDSPDYNHIFLLVGMPPRGPRGWYSLDASMNKPAGWHPPKEMLAKIKDYDVP